MNENKWKGVSLDISEIYSTFFKEQENSNIALISYSYIYKLYFVCARVHACVCAYLCLSAHMCTRACMYIHVYICMCMYAHVYI